MSSSWAWPIALGGLALAFGLAFGVFLLVERVLDDWRWRRDSGRRHGL